MTVAPSVFVSRLAAAFLMAATFASSARAQTTVPNLTGTWVGTLVNEPAKAGAPTIDVTIEIGPMLTADNTCSPWKTTYREKGDIRQVKDYKLCRGAGPDDLTTDEGGGVKLTARWIGGVLVQPFKYDSLLLVVQTRLRGDILEEEIFTIDDLPAVPNGVQPLKPRSIQRLTLRRVTAR